MSRIDDPQGAAEIWRTRLNRDIAAFLAREISDDVFRAALRAHGFIGARLEDEFRYQDGLRITGIKTGGCGYEIPHPNGG